MWDSGRPPVLGTGSRWFNSSHPDFVRVAQRSLERWSTKPEGGSSNLSTDVNNACRAVYNREHYKANKSAYVQKARDWRKSRRIELRTIVWEYHNTHPCIDCGE